MLNKLLAAKKCERKEIEEQMAEEAHHFNEFQASYQKLVDDSWESKIITKNVKQVIANAQAVIAKAQALIQVNSRAYRCEEKAGGARGRQEASSRRSHFSFFQVEISSSTIGNEEILVERRIESSDLGES